jgi:cysteinyl-tRNA synthetase
MSWKHLGKTFDIHGGGIDLVFPHHENEIAQSRCAFHTPMMANYWMHNGFLQVEGEKMSKSLGNFVTIHELLKDWPGEVVRLNMLRTHYRQPMDWTVKGLEESWKILRDWASIASPVGIGDLPPAEIPQRPIWPLLLEALCDDLNTPKAIASIHELRNSIVHDTGDTTAVAMTDALRFFGLFEDDLSHVFDRRRSVSTANREKIEKLISDRTHARAKKDFKESDRIRDELAAMGVVLKDSKDGTTWEIAR